MKHEPQKITELYAWVCTEDDGGDGVPATKLGNLVYPLIGADKQRVESMRPHALKVAQITGRPIKLMKFSKMEFVEQVEPKYDG